MTKSLYTTKSPVLFLVFNRPAVTRRVFDAIRQAQPSHLYVAADGPRPSKDGECARVEEVRQIATQIDWDCNLYTLFQDQNLGCGKAVSVAINWFFENEKEGIILEDDCLPVVDFFRFCDELLDRYRDINEVAHIGGCNPMSRSKRSNSYLFTRYNRIWGWATWARAWKKFDYEMRDWPMVREQGLLEELFPRRIAKLYTAFFDNCYRGEIDTWDFQWFFSRLRIGLAICPEVNLVKNLGFGEDATHTNYVSSRFSDMKVGSLDFPLRAPLKIKPDEEYDKEWGSRWVSPSKLQRLLMKIHTVVKSK